MRSVINFKNSNLNWFVILRHFKNYSKFQSVTAPKLNEKYNDDVSTSVLNTFNKSGNFTTIPNSIDIKSNVSDLNIFNELLHDRYTHQIEIINQMQLQNNQEVIEPNNNNLEYTIHSCLKPLRKELKNLFPDRNIMSEEIPFSVVCLNHHTKACMSSWDSSVANERITLANLFVNSSIEICTSLTECGFWADFIDPYSGTPYYGQHTNDTLFETDPRMRNFGLYIEDLGCCKVLCHPIWKDNVFTGLIFTNAPSDHPILSLLHNEQQ